jgi:alpha-L-rhamnosidase
MLVRPNLSQTSATRSTRLPEPARRLRVEHLRDGRGTGDREPRLSWWLPEGCSHQLAYRITADNCWDTGRVERSDSVLVPGSDLKGPEEFAAFRVADKADVATAYFARSTRLMSRIAVLLGRSDDAARFGALSDDVRRAWQAEFISGDGAITPDTQPNLVRALAFDLLPDRLRRRAAARLVSLIRANDGHLATGFLATPYLLPVLAGAGHLDVAYELLLTDTPPSWLSMIERGATTLWERWDGIRADGTPYESLNHYSKGAVVSFLHRHVAGIQLLDDGPGYRHFRIAPARGGGLSWARARHDSPYGPIESAWTLGDAGELDVSVTVPPQTTAELALPSRAADILGPGAHHVRVGGSITRAGG